MHGFAIVWRRLLVPFLIGLALLIPSMVVSAAGVTIRITEYAYSLSPVTIPAGSTVTWVNSGHITHYLSIETSINFGTYVNSGAIRPGATFSYRFTRVGTWAYRDTMFTFMVGNIVVRKATATTATPAATPRPTARPTAKPTASPPDRTTAKPTVKPKPPTTATASPSPSGSAGSPPKGSAAPSAAGGGTVGPDDGPNGGGPDPVLVAVAGVTLLVLAGLAGAGLMSIRQQRASGAALWSDGAATRHSLQVQTASSAPIAPKPDVGLDPEEPPSA